MKEKKKANSFGMSEFSSSVTLSRILDSFVPARGNFSLAGVLFFLLATTV